MPGVEKALALNKEHARSLGGAVLDMNLRRGGTAYPIADKLNGLDASYVFATGDTRTIGHQGA